MSVIADDKRRQLTKQEKAYHESVVVMQIKFQLLRHALGEGFKTGSGIDKLIEVKNSITPQDLEFALAKLRNSAIEREISFEDTLIQTLHKVFGDPSKMYKDLKLQMHALSYWNPTNHKLNIAPLGIKTDFVKPGERVMIPEPYTRGGKFSSVAGVAPQLQALPRQEDDYLELEPFSYTEWCTYLGNKPSKCCGRTVGWSEVAATRICSKCAKSV